MGDDTIAPAGAELIKVPCDATATLKLSPLAPRPPEDVGQGSEPQIVNSNHVETGGEEAQDEKAGVNPSKKTKGVQQPGVKKAPRLQKSELVDPKKLKEEWISWLLDNWRARAYVVYENGQLDGTGLWNPTYKQENPIEGLSISDGYDRTWFVPTNDQSTFPLFKKDIAESLKRRQDALVAASSGNGNTVLFNSKFRLHMEQEAEARCQNEWDRNKNDPNLPPSTWADVKSTLSTPVLLRIIAKARLIDGRALLPGYYSVNVLELSTEGKLMQRRATIPFDLDTAGVCLRLDTLFPVHGEHTRQVFEAAWKKLNIALKYGKDEGKEIAQSYLKALEKSQYNLDGEGANWLFKLAARENYTLPVGKGPGRPHTWASLIEKGALDALKEGVRSGKHPVMIRLWKLLLRRMWQKFDELEDHLLPTTSGEPELTEEQYDILDRLLAEQTNEERRMGRRMARVLSWLNKPAYRLEFAECDNGVDSGKEGLNEEPRDVKE
ncbi:hypothetical protein EDB81DRAFT_947932 [Dactylonectria macrodidyma]|uniref:Uncharacterized protein n=1 Tax=Dactylonectria macrodidyma TaxID=307937 RepID=A0A9P9J4Q7_9HYPO|nr:hypothetical protein EDB81DRAFT_947932 [Dactylonectria macrodidyma]